LFTLFAEEEELFGVLLITTVLELEDVLDPVAPPLRTKFELPVLVEEPVDPPSVIAVPPAVFVPTEPFPIKLAAEFVFDCPLPVFPVRAVLPDPPVVAAPTPPPWILATDVPECASAPVLSP